MRYDTKLSVNTIIVAVRQNKFPLQPFSKRIMISPKDTTQTQIKPFLPTPTLYDSKVLLVHEAPHLG